MKTRQDKKRSAFNRGLRAAKIATVAAGIGAVVGAAAGLMSAPKKGSELAKDMRREAMHATGALKKRSVAAEREFERAFKRLSPAAQRFLHATKRRLVEELASAQKRLTRADYHDMVEAAFSAVSKGKKEFSNAASALKSDWKRSYDRLKKHL